MKITLTDKKYIITCGRR